MPLQKSPNSKPNQDGMKRVLVVSSLSKSLINFRLQLLKAIADQGHEVLAVGPENDADIIQVLSSIGVSFRKVTMARTGLGLADNLRTLSGLYKICREFRPDLILPYTMKPIVFGNLAGQLAGTPLRYALFTGMGHMFANQTPRGKEALMRKGLVLLHRFALRGLQKSFVYNSADEEDIRRYGLLAKGCALIRVPGSGVDLTHFPKRDLPRDGLVFLLVARLLKDKGLLEYFDAARALKKDYPTARFQLLGPLEPHKNSLTHRDLDALRSEGVVEYLGETLDVRPYLAGCSVFVLPTYYREGIPRSILEALATGRAIITTDIPGCRDTVEEGGNGVLVQPRNGLALKLAMESFLLNPAQATTFGSRSRTMAEQKFDVHAVNQMLLSEMDLFVTEQNRAGCQALKSTSRNV